MDSSFSLKDEIWFLHVCHHISNEVYSRGKGTDPQYIVTSGSGEERGGGSRCKLPGPGGPTMLHMLSYFSTVSLSVDCTNQFFQSKPKSLCKWQFFRFCIKTFSLSALAGGPEKRFFFTGARTRCRRPWLQEEALSLGEWSLLHFSWRHFPTNGVVSELTAYGRFSAFRIRL